MPFTLHLSQQQEVVCTEQGTQQEAVWAAALQVPPADPPTVAELPIAAEHLDSPQVGPHPSHPFAPRHPVLHTLAQGVL